MSLFKNKVTDNFNAINKINEQHYVDKKDQLQENQNMNINA